MGAGKQMHLCKEIIHRGNPGTQKSLLEPRLQQRQIPFPLLSWDLEDLLSLLAPRTTWSHFQTRLPALSGPCGTKVYTEMYLALDHFILISLRRGTINTRPRPWTLRRVGRAVNTKFV